ncbi:hypothetical protein RJ639_023594 [Escallonia herrerae]|uniref:Protein SMG7 n=1 Tax=Escallonia herrerae TaxID=1293975 RepID=A0AA89AEC5_9ASTE|nr:hypothetical protein RJ639_023594 [Escallonia herrerae]
MDKMSAPPSWELAQRLYDKNIELEKRRRKSAQTRVPSDPNAWQQILENYEAIILEDHKFSEQHNIEYALWQLHYRRIEEFRAHVVAASAPVSSATSQNGKVPTRPDRVTKIRLQFKTFLSEATGFYHDLILKTKAKYRLPIGHFSDDSENQIFTEKDGKRSIEMKKGLVSCHRCLIYLGDLARYKGLYGEGDSKCRDYAAASSYYLQAASLWPSSGNPHHQLAILATYSGDELVAVYRYFRSLAVESPFSTAGENLIVAFEKNRLNFSQLHGDAKASAVKESPAWGSSRAKAEARHQAKEINNNANSGMGRVTSIHETYKDFCTRFVRLIGILFTRTSLETFGDVLSLVTDAMCALLTSGREEELNFGTDAVDNSLVFVRLISILIFTVYNVKREPDGQSYADIVQRTIVLQDALVAVFELMEHILMRCVQLSDPSSSYLLPGILVFLEWLACNPDLASGNDKDDKQAAVRSSFGSHFISLLNRLLSDGLAFMDDDEEACFSNMSKYDERVIKNRLAMREDFELRGFLPLQPVQSRLDFSRRHCFGNDCNEEKNARARRILAAGMALMNKVRVDQKTASFDLKLKKFVIGVEPQNPEEMREAASCLGSPALSDSFQEILTESMTNSAVVQLKPQLRMEGDEEDEEIVFKPMVIEKRSGMIASTCKPHEGVDPGQHAFADDSQFYGGPVLAPQSNVLEQTAFDAGSQPLPSVANTYPPHLQSYQSPSSMWLVDQQASLANSLKGMSMIEGHIMRLGMQEDIGVSNASSFSLANQQSVDVNTRGVSCSQAKLTGTITQSQIDTSASSGVSQTKFDNFASTVVNSGTLAVSSALPSSFVKGYVQKPVRHVGPPPGFSSVRPKQVHEPFSGSDLTGQNAVMDDYSWLDGYQVSSSTKGSQVGQSLNESSHSSPLYISNGNDALGTINFPFSGKQVMAVHSEGKDKAWQDQQTFESLNLYHEQLQQQQAIPFPEQHQGQSVWNGRHFV